MKLVAEYVNENQQYDASFHLATFDVLERGGSDGGCHACWPETDGSEEVNCWNQSIDGLLDSDGNTRAAWWATKSYAEMETRRSLVTSTDEGVFGLSGKIGANTYRFIVGYTSEGSNDSKEVSVRVENINSLTNVSNGNLLTVEVYKIPNTGSQPLSELDYIGQYEITAQGEMMLDDFTLSEGEIYVIDIAVE